MMTIQCKCQNLSENREAVATACGLPKDNVRMLLNCVGGSFGYSIAPNTHALVVTAVQNLDMPCSLSLSYDEFNHTTGKGQPPLQTAGLPATRRARSSQPNTMLLWTTVRMRPFPYS
jgi:aldehyde oxidoreductase